MAAAWLAVALASLVLFLRGGTLRFRWLHRDDAPWARHRRFVLRATRPAIHFAAVTLVALAGLGRLDALTALPPEFAGARAVAVDVAGGTLPLRTLCWAMIGGITFGGTIAALVERWRRRPFAIGNIEAVLPRTRGELAWGVVLSFTAGVTEELFFRLALPLLVALAGGSALAGFAIACVLFGVVHRYQGAAGVIATALVGVLLAGVYLLTASLWAAVALHVAIDLNALVLRPIISGRVRLSS